MSVLKEVEGLISSKIDVFKTAFSMMKMEATLAGLSLYPLVLNVCLLLVVLMTTWLFAMLLLAYFSTVAFNNMVLSLLSIVILNGLLLAGLMKYLLFNLRKMSFEKTREFISKKERPHDEQEKKSHYGNNKTGKKITPSSNDIFKT